MKKINEIEIKEDVKVGDIILEKGDKIKILEELGILYGLIGDVSRAKAKRMTLKYIDDYNIHGLILNSVARKVPEIIRDKVSYIQMISKLNEINELKSIPAFNRVNWLIVWPTDDKAFINKVILLGNALKR